MSSGNPDTPAYWIDVGERTLRAFATGVVSAFTLLEVGAVPGAHMSWQYLLISGGMYGGYTLLTCLAAMKVGDQSAASFLSPPDKKVPALKALFARR
jgi:hypothetical protein